MEKKKPVKHAPHPASKTSYQVPGTRNTYDPATRMILPGNKKKSPASNAPKSKPVSYRKKTHAAGSGRIGGYAKAKGKSDDWKKAVTKGVQADRKARAARTAPQRKRTMASIRRTRSARRR